MSRVLCFLTAAAAMLATAAVHGTAQSRPTQRGDFNGDGFADLSIGATFETVNGARGAGAVNVLYGSSTGLTAAADQFWNQNSTGIADFAEEDDHFGSALAVGDFNGDGFGDLAVGVPGETVDGAQAGAVNVVYGSPAGLIAAGNQSWTQNSPGVIDEAECCDRFGAALASGDLNGDGFSDLAIGAPFEEVDLVQCGAVTVLYGSSAGLAAAENQFWTQDSPGILGKAEDFDQFASTLVARDLNADGFQDLAVGTPFEDDGRRVFDVGSVNVIYGSVSGLGTAGNQIWTQDSPGIANSAEANDLFGFSLAAGDFNGDGFGDLAAGSVGEEVGSAGGRGAASVLYGSVSGLSADGNQFWTEDSPGVPEKAEVVDSFGWDLVGRDFNGDGFADLAIGNPLETVGSGQVLGGAVTVLYGSPGGVSASGSQLWTQDSPGIADSTESSDQFGQFVSGGDFDHDGFVDLVVGASTEDIGSISAAGAVNVIYGSATGLASARNQFWNQDTPGVLDNAESDDSFGGDVATR